MTREQLEKTMDDLTKTVERMDNADFGSPERDQITETATLLLMGIGRHVVLCLHDIAENTRPRER